MSEKEIIETLEMIQAQLEWDYPLELYLDLDKVIKYLKKNNSENEENF